MSQESILILCGFSITFASLGFLFLRIERYVSQLSRSIEKIDSTLSVMMQADEHRTKKVITTVEKVVTNSISDLCAKNDIIEHYNDDELYEKIEEMFRNGEEFYTTSQLQSILNVGYARLARILDLLKANGKIVQAKEMHVHSDVWKSIELYNKEMENDV